jgi:hypothetical protein
MLVDVVLQVPGEKLPASGNPTAEDADLPGFTVTTAPVAPSLVAGEPS